MVYPHFYSGVVMRMKIALGIIVLWWLLQIAVFIVGVV
jgi:hypothetical protein